MAKPERMTILAKEFSAAALEYHRSNMAERGYMMEGPITARNFQMVEGMEPAKDLFDGEPIFAVTFRLKDAE